MKLLRRPPRWLPPLVFLGAAAVLIGLIIRLPAERETPAPEFSFRAGGVWYAPGTTATGMLGEPLSVEETCYDAPNRQQVGKRFRTEDYGDTQLTYTYSPANGEWRLTSASTRDPGLVFWPGVQVGDTLAQLRAACPDLQGDPPYASVERTRETEFGPRDFSAFFLLEDGVIAACNLYGDIQGGYALAPTLFAGSAPLALSPVTPQPEAGGGPFPNSFTGELDWPYGSPIPLDWAGTTNTRVLIYPARDSTPIELTGAGELPVLEPGFYFAALFCDLTAQDGRAYCYAASCNLIIG